MHAKGHVRNEVYVNSAGDEVHKNFLRCTSISKDWGVAPLLMDD